MQQPVAKSRPQPQVLVPLREPITSGFGSRHSAKVQQRASMLTAPVKGGQAFSSTCQKKPETQFIQSALIQTAESLQPAPVHSGKYLLAVVDDKSKCEI